MSPIITKAIKNPRVRVVAWCLIFLIGLECYGRLVWDPRLINSQLFEKVGPSHNYGYVLPGPLCQRDRDELHCYAREFFEIYPHTVVAEMGSKTRRIGIVGGSHSHGRYSYGFRVANMLQDKCPGLEWEAMNFSVRGFGSTRMRVAFDELMRYEPSIVLIDPGGSNEYEDERDAESRSRALRGIWFFLLRSHAVVLTNKLINHFWAVNPTKRRVAARGETRASRDEENLLRWEKLIQTNNAAMVEQLSQKGIPALLVGRPHFALKTKDGQFPRFERLTKIYEELQTDHIRYVDIHGIFPKVLQQRRTMFSGDRNHYSRRGHRLIAKHLVPRIIELLDEAEICDSEGER